MYCVKTLELNKVLSQISDTCLSQSAKNHIFLKEPSAILSEVKDRLDFVDEFCQVLTKYGSIPLLEDFDIYNLLQKTQKALVLSINEVLHVRLLLAMEINILDYSHQVEESLHKVKGLLQKITNHQKLADQINIVMNAQGEINDHASDDLRHIRYQLNAKYKQLDQLLVRLTAKYSAYLSENIITKRNDRHVILVKESYKNNVKGIIHDTSASGQTVYIEPLEIKDLQNSIDQLLISEQNEIFKILSLLTQKINMHTETLKENIDLFVILDEFQAIAKYSNLINGVKPKINNTGTINLINAKHPLIDPKVVVPITISFQKDIKIILITGPNTGGKTVALKTLGLLTLMTQCGILIPVSSGSEVNIFDAVFADIGDEQSIEQSLSTFSSHITKIKDMLKNINQNQLILLDEIGSGTDPIEGVALASAILDYLRQYQIKSMITTHYSELKLYALKHNDVLNASVSFDHETLKPLYKLRLGIAGSSQALDIAKRIGLAEEILVNANTYLGQSESNLSKELSNINYQQLVIEKKEEELNQKINELNQEITNYQQQQLSFNHEKDQMIKTIKSKEEAKIAAIKGQLNELLQELKDKEHLSLPESSTLKNKIKQASVLPKVPFVDFELNVGDYVYVESYQQQGYVTALKKNQFVVALGNFSLTFDKQSLQKIDKPQTPKTTKVKTQGKMPVRMANYDIDLRGKRYEEVKYILDTAIDRAFLADFNTLRIIHGHGTGAIRKAVYEYIKKSSFIESHRFGGEGEGLNGVTIITLKNNYQ